MQSQWKLIIFDWDGTLMDSTQKIVFCMQNAIEKVGLPKISDQAIQQIIGLSLEKAVAILLPAITYQDKQSVINYYRDFFFTEDLCEEQLFSNVYEVLNDLTEKGYDLAIATGKSRKGLDKALEKTQLKNLFITTRCADESFSKPNPQMLEDILEFTAITSKDALMIGDTTYDLEMAYYAKMASIAVNYGAHSYKQLSQCPYPPFAYLDDIKELLEYL